MKYIKNCDFLYTEAKFTFNESGITGKKTIFGGIISIFIIFISLGITIYFTFCLFNNDDSSVIFSTKIDPYINITYSHKLPFMIRLSNSYSIPYLNQTSRLYNIYLKLWYGGTNNTNLNENNKQYYDDIKISKCDINKHFGDYKNYFKNIPDLETYYCPDIRNYNQTIYGLYGENKPFSYLHFYIIQCTNETMNNTCFDIDYINKQLSGTYLDIKSIGFKMNSLKKKVGEIEIESKRFLVSNSVYKRIWMYIKKINYITDNGIFLTSNSNEIFHTYDNIRTDIDIRDINNGNFPGTFLTLSILNSSQISLYYRKYKKIQDYIATISGIIKALYILGSLINYYNGKNSYYFFIIKHFMIRNNLSNDNKKFFNRNINKNSIQYNNNISVYVKGIKNISPFPKKNKLSPNYSTQKNITFQKKSDEDYDKIKLYNKFSSSFFPPSFFGYSKKDRMKHLWYIENINKRLNIINVLNLLKKIEEMKINKSNYSKKSLGNIFNLITKNDNKKNLEKEQSLNIDNSELPIN